MYGKADDSLRGCVNALNGATFISTVANSKVLKHQWNCVNALNEATFISTNQSLKTDVYPMLCQCPEWGDLHFHCITVCKNGGAWNGVNALNGATFISTERKIRGCKANGIVSMP